MTASTIWLGDLFRLYHKEAVRFAARLVGSLDSGEEVVQDAWVKICARTAETALAHPKTYLFAATRNSAIDFTVRQRREWAHRVDIETTAEGEFADNAERLWEQRRELARLAVLLNELPDPCRKAFILNKLEGWTHVEIARDMRISVSMVEKHVMRALLHVRNFPRD